MRKRIVSLFLLGVLANTSFSILNATGQYQTHATPVSRAAVYPFREPFKDFFDYEWWLQGSTYAGKGYQHGKWMVIEANLGGDPQIQLMYISNENAITGTDSARMELDGSAVDVNCFAWQGLYDSPDPERLIQPEVLNPAHLRLRFRIDEWTTNEPSSWPWRVTLAALCGGYIHFFGVVVIGLEGAQGELPHLILRTRKDASGEWDGGYGEQIEKISSQTINIGQVYTLEIMRFQDAVNGLVAVFLDDAEVTDLRCENIDTNYPGIHEVALGSNAHEEDNYFSRAQATGSRCTITLDDFRVRDQFIGMNPLPKNFRNLTLDSSPQDKTVRVGNWIVGQTPVTINVPEGTIPKVGVEPADFNQWEIIDNYTYEQKELFGNYSEIWPEMSPSLIATVTQAPPAPGRNIGPRPTPAIYSDTRITAMYNYGTKHTLNVTSNPIATSFTVDGLDYITPWGDTLTEGTHTIAMPSTFTVGEKKYDFRKWEDNSSNPTRTVNLVRGMQVTAYYYITIVPEFTPSIAWLLIVGVAALVILLSARKLKLHSRIYRCFYSK